MEGDYLNGSTVDERVSVIADTVSSTLNNKEIGDKFKEYMKRGWYSLSTPMWTNFGTDRGLPMSCYGSYIDDTMDSILYSVAEVGKMTKLGGGTSGTFSSLRARGTAIRNNGTSNGPVHFMQMFESLVNVCSQGNTRRGNFAAYLSVDHPDILEFLTIRNEGAPIQDLSFGVTVPAGWMQSMIDGDTSKRSIWAKIIESRSNKGFPYIVFLDNMQNGAPEVYKDAPITHSNLCTEIALPDNENESFVCNLSSMNLLHYDEWKDTDAVEVLVHVLDAAMTEFITKASIEEFMRRAVKFAIRNRAIGIGVLGWHSLLQSKMIPIESEEASRLNVEIFELMQRKSYAASRSMAEVYGASYYSKDMDRRHTTLMAIAPTKSSSFILGQVSEGIEPHRANYYVKDLAKGKFTIKNHELERLLESHGKNTDEVWTSILKERGSVQHLDFLTKEEKAVFKTFREIDQKVLLKQAADRQKFIDQAQSINVMIDPKRLSPKDVSQMYIKAWQDGVKSLYYQISVNAAQEFARVLVENHCTACEL